MNRIATHTTTPAAPARSRKTKATEAAAPAPISKDERDRMIAEAAYYRALSRGFQTGYELADWLDAEKEIDTRLLA